MLLLKLIRYRVIWLTERNIPIENVQVTPKDLHIFSSRCFCCWYFYISLYHVSHHSNFVSKIIFSTIFYFIFESNKHFNCQNLKLEFKSNTQSSNFVCISNRDVSISRLLHLMISLSGFQMIGTITIIWKMCCINRTFVTATTSKHSQIETYSN